ncbi:MAG: GNAT family N-acetyltransferase, partial [Microbacterium sp.]
VERLPLPESRGAPDARDVLAYIRASNDGEAADTGTDLFVEDPAASLIGMKDTKFRERILLVARHEGEAVGFGVLRYSRSTEANADVMIAVAPEHRDDEVADALLTALEQLARERGRSRLIAYGISPATSAHRLPSPTGFGTIDADGFHTRAMQRAGYSLGQVERVSFCDLRDPIDTSELLSAAWEKAGDDYRVEWWDGPVPDEYAESLCRVITRMDTDPPDGELDWEPDVYTVKMLRKREARAREIGAMLAVTALVHVPTNEVVAFNELYESVIPAWPSNNGGTLVMPDHRGRRLGMIVKAEGLLRFREAVPDTPGIITFNAEENRYMLDVNEAVGFRPVAYEGAWQKDLSPGH